MKKILFYLFAVTMMLQANMNVHAMVNGVSVTPKDSGVLLLSMLGQTWCTATVLTPEWAVTAAHCFDTSRNPNDFKLQMSNKVNYDTSDANATEIDKIYVHEKYSLENREFDIALIKINRLPIFPSNTGYFYDSPWPIKPWLMDSSFITGQYVTCYGYGRDEHERNGTLKTGRFVITSETEAKFKLSPAGSATTGKGDSGGPCFLDAKNGTSVYLGAISGIGTLTGSPIIEIGAIGKVKNWALNIMYGAPSEAVIGGRTLLKIWNGEDYILTPAYQAGKEATSIWNPCSGSKYDLSYSYWIGEYATGKGTASFDEIVKVPYCNMFGCGERDQRASRYLEYTDNGSKNVRAFGGVVFNVKSDAFSTSLPGFINTKASCDLAVKCLGDSCFTLAHKDVNGIKGGGVPSNILPPNTTTDYVWWNPCNGGCYNYVGESNFEQNYVGYAQIFQYNNSGYLEPKNTFIGTGYRYGRLCGGAYVQVSTRAFSVNNKSFSLQAKCDAY